MQQHVLPHPPPPHLCTTVVSRSFFFKNLFAKSNDFQRGRKQCGGRKRKVYFSHHSSVHSFRQMGRQFDQGSEHPKDQASGCSKKKALSIMNPRKKDEDAEGRERERERHKMLKDKNQSILFIILAHILSVCS